MATKNVRLPEALQQKVDEATKRQIYRKVGPKMGGELLISGAEKKWKTQAADEEFFYVPDLRIVGTEKAVRKYLVDNELAKSEIDASMKRAFTKERVKTGDHKKRYEAEISALEEFRKNRSRTQSKYDLDELIGVAQQIKEAGDKMPTDKATVRKTKATLKKKAAPAQKKVALATVKKKEPAKEPEPEPEEEPQEEEPEEPTETVKKEAKVAAKPVARGSSAAAAAKQAPKQETKKGSGPAATGKPLAKQVQTKK